jgi:hypothetical protein
MGSRKPVRLTFIDKYIQQGKQQGERRGKAEMLLRQIQVKFGPPGPEVEACIEQAELKQLEDWLMRMLTAQSLDKLFG